MVVFRYKTIWLSSSFRFWTWFERLVLFVTGMTNIRDVIPSKNTIERRVLIFY
jgi:hypothetical protein